MPPSVVNLCSITVPFDTYQGVDTELIPEEEAETLGIAGGINAKRGFPTLTRKLLRNLGCEQSCLRLLHHNSLNKLKNVFREVLIPRAVYEENCIKGRGLLGERELREAVKKGLIAVKEVKNHLLVNALLGPLAIGEAETVRLTA